MRLSRITLPRRFVETWRGDALLILLFTLAWAGVAAWVLTGERTFFAFHDNGAQYWPWYQRLALAAQDTQLLLWDATRGAGSSFVGETQPGVFYLPQLVWFAIAGDEYGISVTKLDFFILLHVWLGGVGTAMLARQLGLGRTAALVAALLFAFTGPFLARAPAQVSVFYGLAALPWAACCAVRYVRLARLRWAAAAGATLGAAIMAGHYQPALHGAMLITIVMLFSGTPSELRSSRHWRQRLGAVVLAGATTAVVAAPQLAYTFTYFDHAVRFTSEATPTFPGETIGFGAFTSDHTGDLQTLLSLVDPSRYTSPDSTELFITLAALSIIALALVAARDGLRTRLGRFALPLGLVGALGFFAYIGAWTPVPRVLHSLPLLAQVRELGRYSILIHLPLILLVAASLDALLRLRALPAAGRRCWNIAAVILGLNAAYLWLESDTATSDWFAVQLLLGAAALALAGSFAQGARRDLKVAGLVLVIAVAAVGNAYRVTPTQDSPSYPGQLFARTPTITVLQEQCSEHRIMVLDESLPANIGNVFPDVRSISTYGATVLVSLYNILNTQPLPDMAAWLDVGCVVSKTTDPPEQSKLVFKDPESKLRIHRTPNPGPLRALDGTALDATSLEESDQRRRFRVRLETASPVVITSPWAPGWKARLDGQEIPHSTMNLRGAPALPIVELPAGEHELEWSTSGWPAW